MCTAKAVPELFVATADVKDAILQHLSAGPSRPTEMLDTLGNQYSDFQLKEGLLRLLQEGVVEMTSDRRLKLAGTV